MRHLVPAIAVAAAIASPAHSSDEGFEVWLNPSISTDLDADTAVELETAQRLRSADDGRGDTYFFRLWLKQDLTDAFTLAGAVERRINDGGRDETRTMQQLSGRHGVLRTRLRFEQRFVDGADRRGLRLRPRVGVSFPLDEAGRWSAGANEELFWTLRGTRAGGDDGITGLRTQIGLGYEVSDRVELSLTYLRQQDFEPGGPDKVGHAPLIGLEYSF